ncbi:ABC transporter permease [Meiothermus sp.]|uniref:ABC transporter permease n=1 Tax=Meiothermus sp. TaxID=1955249 RepID=UPI0021DB90FF|nr:ABC transporter permease [Meiothermus sp.]GIW33387.1 MAG: hypothetical protein KatS3mg072_0720 [Meiothermus sp.]
MLQLITNEACRNLILFRRYLGESVASLVVLMLVFYGLFLGTRYMAGPTAQFGDRLDAMVVGFVLWTLILSSFAGLAQNLAEEAQTGVMEQVFLSSYPPTVVFLARCVSSVGFILLVNGAVLAALILLTGARIVLPLAVIPPVITILMASYGLGFALASLALRFKRVTQLVNLGQFALLFLVMTPFEHWQSPVPGYVLPMAPGVGLTREVMAHGGSLDGSMMSAAALNGLVYLALGVWAFQVGIRKVKSQGLLSGY